MYALIAQLDRVHGYEPWGREFESLWARFLYFSLIFTLQLSDERDSKKHFKWHLSERVSYVSSLNYQISIENLE